MDSEQHPTSQTNQHPAPGGVSIYYWPCSLVLFAPSLILDRLTNPLCATLRISCTNPYTIKVGDKTLVTRASLVAPRAGRKSVKAIDSDIALFYLPLDSPENSDLKEVLGNEDIVELPISAFESFIPTIKNAMTETLTPDEIKALSTNVVRAITGKPQPSAPAVDERILLACKILDDMPLSEVRLDKVAQLVHLSASRLRGLFKKQTGFNIGEYARWRGVWRSALLWKHGLTWTAVAQQAGFHDLAHMDKAFNEVFGMNPTAVIDPKYVTLVNCE